MSTIVLLTLTGLGLAALYFLVASGLSLVFGLVDVLNFAHGAFLSVGAYAAWWSRQATCRRDRRSGRGSLLGRRCSGSLVGAAVAALVELVLIRPLYRRPIEQVLVTVGLSLAPWRCCRRSGAPTPARSRVPPLARADTASLGAHVPNDRFARSSPRRWCSSRCSRSCGSPGTA